MKRRTAQILNAAHGIEPPESSEQPVETQTDDRLTGWQTAAANAFGLPDALAPRLQGGSEAEVFLDASRLAKELAPTESPSAEVAALTQRALQHAREVRGLGVGVVGGSKSPPPIELPPEQIPERPLERSDD